MIREINIENVKGQTASQKLTGKDIIIGRNGAGKTTRIQSIGLAMLGYVPGKGKTTADTFKLASDDEMGVRMETDTFSVERRYAKSRKLKADGREEVKISQALSVSPSMGESTNAQKEQRIRQELGDFPVMLDFGAFIAMTDNQQRDFIYSLSGNGATWDRARVEKEMNLAILTPEMLANNPDMYECMDQCIVEAMNQYRDGMDVQAGILAVAEYAKERLSYWKKEKVNADGAAKKLTELKNRGQDTDRELAANLEKLKELQAKREQLIKELAELSAANKILEEKAEALKKLQEEIAAMADAPGAERLEELEASIKELEAELAEMEHTDVDFMENENSIQNTMASLQEELKTRTELVNHYKVQLATIDAEIKANGDLLQRIADSHGCCAFSPNIPCNQDFSGFIEETHHLMDAAYEKKDAAQHELDEANEAMASLKKQIEDTQEATRRLQEEKKEHNQGKEEKRKQLEKSRTEISELKGREPLLAAKRQQEAEIASYLSENQLIDLTAMEDQKTLLTGQIESLEATIDEQKKIRNDILNIKANIIDSQSANIKVLCWTQVCNAIGQKGIKGEIVKEMLVPILEEVSSKLHEIGIQEKFFFNTTSETGKEVFEFGWGNRPFEALSTGEQLLLMTALMTAIIERANPPIKVLTLDNINDLDRNNLSLIMRGLNTIGKNMDNIVLAGVVEPTEEDCEGWTVWRL